MASINDWAAGKVVLVTGSTSGIGREVALQYAKLGAQVILNGRNETRLAQAVEECNAASPNGQKAVGIRADMSKRDEVKLLADQAMAATGGKLDILINNHGLGLEAELAGIENPDMLDGYDRLMEINLRSVIQLCNLLVPFMLKTVQPGSGSIINISSVAARKPRVLPYSVSKAALDMATQCLALELGPKGIRVNSVNPALVETNFFEKIMPMEKVPGLIETFTNLYPLRRVGQPADIANYVLFLTSPAGSWITGTNNIIDGGHMLLSPAPIPGRT